MLKAKLAVIVGICTRHAWSVIVLSALLAVLAAGIALVVGHVHEHALYLLLFVVPALGWAGTNAYGDPVSVFGLFDFPRILGKDTPLSDRIFVWHLYGGLVVAAIAALHAAGALYHGLVKRDGVLARMLPGG